MSALRLPNKAPRASGPGPVESITIASGSLAEAVAAREGAKVASLLDNLTLYLADKPWNTVPVDTLVVAWTLCGEVLDAALGREVTLKALTLLNSTITVCATCSNAMLEDPVAQLHPQAIATKIGLCLATHPADAAIHVAGLAVLLTLGGCTTCSTATSTSMQTELAAGAAIETIAVAISSCLAPAHTAPAAVLDVAIPALAFVCAGHGANLGRLAACNGLALLLAALQRASSSAAVGYGLSLLSSLTCADCTTADQVQAAATAVWASARKQRKALDVDVARSALQAMSAIMDRATRLGIYMETYVVEGVSLSRHFMETYDNKDDLLIKHCLNFMTVAATHVVDAQSPSAVAAALTNPDLTVSLVNVAAKAATIATQCMALRTLHSLLTAVPAPANPEATTSILALLEGTRSAKEVPALSALTVNVYGLACLAALAPVSEAIGAAPLLLECTAQVCAAMQSHCVAVRDVAESGSSSAVAWPVLESGLTLVMSVLLSSPSCGVNAVDTAGCALLHRLAALGDARCLALLLKLGGKELDLLVRTPAGANALQLARQGGHADAEWLLLDITQQAAEARQEALLKEVAEASGEGLARKGRKKKTVTRSTSFATDQPDEKFQKLEAEEEGDDAEKEAGSEERRLLEEKLQRQQQLEEEYERALELRRLQLAEEKRQAEQRCLHTVRTLPATATMASSPEESGSLDDAMSTGSGSRDQETRVTSGRSDHRPSTPVTVHGEDAQAFGDSQGDSQTGTESMSASGDETAPSESAPTQTDTDMGSDGVEAPTNSPFLQYAQQASARKRTLPEASSLFDGMLEEHARAITHHHAQQAMFGGGLFGSMADHAVPLAPHPSLASDTSLQHMHSLQAAGAFSVPHSQFQSPLNGGMLSPPQTQSTGALGLLERPHSLLPQTLEEQRGRDTSSAHQARLQENRDALFVHDGALPAPHPANPVTSTEASLFASLRDSVTGAAQVAPQVRLDSPPRSSVTWAGQGMDSGDGMCVAADGDGADSDESSEPTRHLWIGNLGTRTVRSVLKNIFERFGYVDDVVTFPGRMYAFVNYRTTSEAIMAFKTLNAKVVPELSGERPLLLKFRPAKKAAAHLRALTERLDSVDVCDDGRLDLDRDGNCSEPSPRIWLGNIAPTASTKSLQAVLARYGPLTDAAVFPARIGPLGYAFVKFERLEDAMRSFEALNNTVVPSLSGTKQLKMRYKPATEGPVGREEGADAAKGPPLSRHLWLGNVTQKPTDEAVADIFTRYGKVDSVRIFPAKAYAFVNFADPDAALTAMKELDGVPVPLLTGIKPLVMRYQQEGHTTPSPATKPIVLRSQSETALGLINAAHQLVPGGLMGMPPSDASSSDDGLVPGQLAGGYGLPHANSLNAAALAEQLRALTARAEVGPYPGAGYMPLGGGGPAGLPLHRAHSMTPLGPPQPQAYGGNAAAAAAAAAATASAAQFASLMGMQSGVGHLGGYGTEALGMQPAMSGGGYGGMQGFIPQQQHLQQHQQFPGGMASATPAPKLTAVLNNLMALQRANSMGGSGPMGDMSQQLLQLGVMPQRQQGQQQAGLGYNFGNGGFPQQQHDIASLSALLANQSLSSFSHSRNF